MVLECDDPFIIDITKHYTKIDNFRLKCFNLNSKSEIFFNICKNLNIKFVLNIKLIKFLFRYVKKI